MIFPFQFCENDDIICACPQLLISAYKLKNWTELARILKTEFSVIVAGHVEDKVKLVFWQTLLTRPMELEVVEMIKNVRSNLLVASVH